MVDSSFPKDQLPPTGDTKIQDVAKYISLHRDLIVKDLGYANKEFGSLPVTVQQKMGEVFEDEWKSSPHGADNSLERRFDLALKTRVPALLEGNAEIDWSQNMTGYARKIKEIRGQYTTNGSFDKEGFTLAMVKQMMELSAEEARPSQRAILSNTLLLMTSVGVLSFEDINTINSMVKGIVGSWSIKCDHFLFRPESITREEFDKVEAVGKRMEDFSYHTLVDGNNDRSVLMRMQNPLNATAINDFKHVYGVNS